MNTENHPLLVRIKNALIIFDVDTVTTKIRKAIQEGVKTETIIEVMSEGMDIVGQKFESHEYFVPELIMAGETMKEAFQVLEPYIQQGDPSHEGTILVATVEGDIHDIGKNIFITLMTTFNLKVIDLGVDVSADKIVEAVKQYRPDILGLSALLTTNLEQFPKIVDLLEEEGHRDHIKIIVGGATVTQEYARESGVDAYAKTALEGVEICKRWLKLS